MRSPETVLVCIRPKRDPYSGRMSTHQSLCAGLRVWQGEEKAPRQSRCGDAVERSSTAGIGVAPHPGYNAAQRLYGKRGYIPDGLGITCDDHFLQEGAPIALDDQLVLHLIKRLRPEHRYAHATKR